ncbi:helix-turn-helix domain-containing protein [Bradyrhizobium sp. CCBAU 21359]
MITKMLRLSACGWGLTRIARQLDCSDHTVKDLWRRGDAVQERSKRLDGL